MKARIKLNYPDEILFISPGYRIQEAVISSHCLETKTIAESIQYLKKAVMQKAPEILRECVKDMKNSHSTVSWPLKVEELQFDERKPPELLRYFYETLLLSKSKSETYTRFVDSFSSDIVFGISNGKLPLYNIFHWV